MPTLRQRIGFLSRLPARYLWYLLQRKLGRRQLTLNLHGQPLVVPLQRLGGVQLAYMADSWMTPLLRKLLPASPGTFVDVGANVGITLVALRLVDAKRPWIGFEPSPASCAYIRELVAANQFLKTTLIEAGLGEHDGPATLYAGGGTDSSATMIRDFPGELAKSQDLEIAVRLIDGAKLHERELTETVGVVKIDVEGMELEVVRGLKNVLARDKPVIIFEAIPTPDDGSERAKRMLGRQAELTAEFRSLGYRIAQIRPGKGLSEVAAPQNDAPLTDSNYLAIASEKYDEVVGLLQ